MKTITYPNGIIATFKEVDGKEVLVRAVWKWGPRFS